MVPMKSTYRRWSAAAGTLTVLAMGGLTVACGSQGNHAPTTVTVTPSSTTTTTTTTTAPATTSAPAPAPTEKGGPVQDDPFSPTPPTHTQNRHHGDH